MASGVKIDDSVKEVFQQIALTTSKTKKLLYAVFTFSDNLSKIVVESQGDADSEGSDYESVISALPPNDVRYLAYDFQFIKKDESKGGKVICISWHPETSAIKKKMLVSSSFGALKTALGVNSNAYEGDTLSEINTEAILEKLGGVRVA